MVCVYFRNHSSSLTYVKYKDENMNKGKETTSNEGDGQGQIL